MPIHMTCLLSRVLQLKDKFKLISGIGPENEFFYQMIEEIVL